MIFQTLNGKWVMNERGSEAFVEAQVPGSVLSALLVGHRTNDPFFGINEEETRQLFRKDYFFSTEFELIPELFEQEKIVICCKGIDTLARVYVNNMLVGTCDNMHRTYNFNVKPYLHLGINMVMVELMSPINYIENRQPASGKEVHYTPAGCTPGNQYLRKTHCMFGWDWGANIPDCGIWRSIDLIGYSLIRIDDVNITQKHEKKTVTLDIDVKAELIRKDHYIIQAELVTPDGKVSAITETLTDEQVSLSIEIDNPKLWWPHGFGDQPLYTVSIFALDMNGNQWDSKTYRIGLRTMTVSTDKDEFGKEFCFVVNNIRIFSMGANYIPEDTIYSFITKEKIDYLLRSAVKCNFNTIRVWGGGYYPSDTFYDLCDEYGLIVWQDLMFANNIYELSDDFAASVTAEAEDNIKRIRHHACLGLICGNNEMENAWVEWPEFRAHSDELRKDYLRMFEDIIPGIARSCAPQVFYWPSSPSSGGRFDKPSDETRGDVHCWDVWHGLADFEKYEEHTMRFVSEFGFQSFPSIKTVKTFTNESDRNVFSKVMESHQKNKDANGKLIFYLSHNFLFPKDFESLLYLTQILQAIAIKRGVEHWRRNRGCVMGTLYWQFNDSWPVASWSSIDYFGRWKPLQYFSKYFYAQIAGSIKREGNVVSPYIVNETRDFETRRVRVSLQTMEFRLLHEEEHEVDIAPFSAVKVCEIDYTELIRGMENSVFVEAEFFDEEGNIQSTEIDVFVKYKYLNLEGSSISYSVIELADEYVIRMMSGGFAAFVELDLLQADAIFSDNYFHLTSKREKTVRLKKSDIRYLNPNVSEIQNRYELEQQLVIRTLKDTY